jgi:NAD+ synthase (glutamine-hydrolysing)
MNNYGFIKVAAAIPFGEIGNISKNAKLIIDLINEANDNNASIVLLPELSLTGYTCGDLFNQSVIIEESIKELQKILIATSKLPILAIFGIPIINNNQLYNCACVINRGKILGLIPKSYIAGYKEFYEPRWFSGAHSEYNPYVNIEKQKVRFGTDLIFTDIENEKLKVGVEICEDLWVPIPPSSYLTLSGANIICNLSASNILIGKKEYRRELIKNQSGRCICGYIYASSGMGESTTDVVFDADAVIAENNVILAESKRFLRENQIIYSEIDIEKLIYERVKINTFENLTGRFEEIPFQSNSKPFRLTRIIDPHPFIPKATEKLNERCEEIFNIQSAGLIKRFESIKENRAIIGVSGGLDSTLALLITYQTFNKLKWPVSDIIAVTMPGFGTTSKTKNNIKELCKALCVELKEIEITDISENVMKKIGQDESNYDITFENIQARIRTLLLMNIANKENGIVIGTGDLSEIALGWSTYNGDHISMYNVNSGIPKTLVKFLVKWIADNIFENEIRKILYEIVNQPITPELLPGDGINISQKTEEKIGPFELNDFFLYYFVRFGFKANKILYLAKQAFEGKYNEQEIKKWLILFFNRFFKNQWKRDCVPGGVKIGSIDLSPRGSWRMPSEASIDDFLKNLE